MSTNNYRLSCSTNHLFRCALIIWTSGVWTAIEINNAQVYGPA